MFRYILKRLLQAIPTLIGISFLSFALMRLAPGDPVSLYADPSNPERLTAEALEELREQLGFNDPIPVQYGRWLQNTLQGNWGYSVMSKQPVLDNIMDRLPNTIKLGSLALLLALLVAIPIGTMAAIKQYSRFDYLATFMAFIGLSIPSFWFALILMQFFSLKLGWLPAVGMRSVDASAEGGVFLDTLKHFAMPTIVMSMASMASWTRYQRSSILEVMRQEYIRTARAKGLREFIVISRHALKNALIPMITLLGLSIPTIVSGSYIIETIFAWPGIGRLGVTAIFSRDYALVMGVTMTSAIIVVLSNLVADIAYSWVNPSIRYE
ncbi:MAG: ABC transporter permease [Anaerolineales bacterium]|nr:ABC transporter permease [Anaerolineales bacterium]